MKKITLPNILNPIYFKPNKSKNFIDSLKFTLKKTFGFDNLENLHQIKVGKGKVSGWNTDQISLIHKTVYADFDKKKSVIIPEDILA